MIIPLNLTVFLSFSLCFYLLLILIWFLNKVWWTPIYIQHVMRSQGIRGPSYKFLHGSTIEITSMQEESFRRPMELTHNLFPRILPHIFSWKNLYGLNFLQWYGPEAQLVINDPELIKELLQNKNGTYSKKEVEGYLRKLLGDGLVTSQGEKWVKMRKLANHDFHAESLKGLIPTMVTYTELMLQQWKLHDGKEIEVYEEFKVLTSEIISRTAFGSSYLEGKNIFKMINKLGVLLMRNTFKIRIPIIGKIFRTSDDFESSNLELGIKDSIIKIIKKREEKRMSGEIENFGNDFLGSLIKVYHDTDTSKNITLEDVIDECKTFYIAGQETTATLLAWTVFLLALHTDWQDEARKEVFGLIGQQNPNADAVARFRIMSMILNESLRLYAPVTSLNRYVKREVRLGKLVLPANMEILIPILALHHNPDIWGEDAHIFNPKRFSEGVSGATNSNTSAYLPFGSGPRICVGMNFAFAEAKIVLSMILQRFKFTLSPNYVHAPIQILTICPQYGVQVMLHKL